MIKLHPGQVVRFSYTHDPAGVDEDTGDRFKEVLILNPNWQGKVHCIDLKRLTTAEREVLDAILSPEQAAAAKSGSKPHRFPLVNDILKRMVPLEEIKNPVSFYSRFVKVFLRNKDAYRTYYSVRMSAITVVQKSEVHGGVTNPKPLFHAVESKPTEPTKPTTPTTGEPPKNRLDQIRARALKKKDD